MSDRVAYCLKVDLCPEEVKALGVLIEYFQYLAADELEVSRFLSGVVSDARSALRFISEEMGAAVSAASIVEAVR